MLEIDSWRSIGNIDQILAQIFVVGFVVDQVDVVCLEIDFLFDGKKLLIVLPKLRCCLFEWQICCHC